MDNRTKNIYIHIKNHLPEWLDDNINYNNPTFVSWCAENQNIFLLIIDELLTRLERNNTIAIESLQGSSYVAISKRYDISADRAKSIVDNILKKVLAILKDINKVSLSEINSSNEESLFDDIKYLKIPIRVYNALIRNNFTKISKLKEATYKELKSIKDLRFK